MQYYGGNLYVPVRNGVPMNGNSAFNGIDFYRMPVT
jgi:hypothetical protein